MARDRIFSFLVFTTCGRCLLAIPLALIIVWVDPFGLRSRAGQDIEEKKPALLNINPQFLNFGQVWEDSHFEVTLPVENCSDQLVEIIGFTTSCNYCSKIEPAILTILPKETKEVRLTLDLSRKPCGGGDGSIAMRLQARLPVDDERAPIEPWILRGQVMPVMSLEPANFALGRHSERAQPFQPATMIVKGLTPLRNLRAECNVPSLQVQVAGVTGSDSEFELTIAPKNKLPVTMIDAQVLLTPLARDGTSLPSKTVQIEGSIVADIQTDPLTIFIGPKTIGQWAEEVVSLESLTGRVFRVARVELPSADVQAVPETGLQYRIRQRIAQPMNQATTIRFHIVAADGTEEIVTINVRYYGLAGIGSQTP